MNRKATCIIVDDEPAAHYVLQNYLSKVAHIELVSQCYNGIEAINFLHHHTADLMFLDIDMPEITGLQLLKTLQHPPKTILSTAYSEFALESYEYGVIDYLLKPIYFPRFLTAIERFFSLYAPAGSNGPEQQEVVSEIMLRIDGENIKIALDELLYVQSLGNYVKLFTTKRSCLASLPTTELESLLPAQRFVRIHKSYIAALDRITQYGKDYICIGDIKLPVGITYRQKLAEIMRS